MAWDGRKNGACGEYVAAICLPTLPIMGFIYFETVQGMANRRGRGGSGVVKYYSRELYLLDYVGIFFHGSCTGKLHRTFGHVTVGTMLIDGWRSRSYGY